MTRQAESSHVPGGEFERKCPACGIIFRTDIPHVRYCSMRCKRKAENRQYYLRHKDQIIERVLKNQRQK